MLGRGEVVCDGADSDFQYYRVGSFTTVGEEYEITIDKRTGFVDCGCPDALFRKRKGFFMDSEGVGCCKHGRALCRLISIIRRREDR